MKGTILLDYNENIKQVEEEEKTRFLRGLLEQFFENTDIINKIQEIWNVAPDIILNVEQKIKIRNLFTTFGIQVIDDLDGNMKVYIDNELVAEWFKCTYKLKKDLQQIDPNKKIYLEMNVNYFSVFESEQENK